MTVNFLNGSWKVQVELVPWAKDAMSPALSSTCSCLDQFDAHRAFDDVERLISAEDVVVSRRCVGAPKRRRVLVTVEPFAAKLVLFANLLTVNEHRHVIDGLSRTHDITRLCNGHYELLSATRLFPGQQL
jgi:hypothetical protein